MAARRKDRVWIVVGVLASVVVIALSWLFFINPQLGDKSAAEQQTADAQVQNAVLQQKINKLRQDAANSASLQAQLDQARDALPTAHDLDEFTRQLTAQAQKSGVTVVSITPASPVQVQGQTAPAPTTDADTDTGGNAATTTAPAAPTSTGPAGQLYAIQVTLITDGTVEKQQALLTAIQTEGPRAALVLSSKLAPDQATAAAAAPTTTAPATTAPTTKAPASSTRATSSGTKAATSTTGSGPSGAPQQLIDTWTMTTVLQVFVAPVSPQDEAALQTVAASK